MGRVRCIIRDHEADEGYEHIIPGVLGGALTTGDVCDDCNHRLSPLDQFLASDWFMLLSRIRHQTPEWEEAATRLYGGSRLDDGVFMRVKTDLRGMFEAKNLGGPPVVEEKDGKVTRVLVRPPQDAPFEELARLAKRVAKRHGLPIPTDEQLCHSLAQDTKTLDRLNLNFSFKIDLTALAVAGAKIAYEFACQTLGERYLDDPGAASFRELLTRDLAEVREDHDLVTNGFLLPAGLEGARLSHPDLPGSLHVIALLHEGDNIRVRIRLFDQLEGAYAITPNPDLLLKPGQGRIYTHDVVSGESSDGPHRALVRRLVSKRPLVGIIQATARRLG